MKSNIHPFVSVCFLCYNQKKYVAQALYSVINQTYDNFEIVISDDCSTDGTKEIVSEMSEKYKDQRKIDFFSNFSNLGVWRNTVMCCRRARGELIIMAADDDISMPNRVSQIVKCWMATDKKASVLVSGWYKINERGQYVGEQGPWGGGA